MNINLTDLRRNSSGIDYEDGYRIIYFCDNKYKIGEYCKSIEGFMIGFAECDPIIDCDDVPKFISTTDLLNRYLKEMNEIDGVAIYNVNGQCVDKINRRYKTRI